jgi:hypothetical protein
MSGWRAVAGLLAMMLGASAIGVLPCSTAASAAAADPAESDSAVTVSGTGDFATLKVTVSQTRNLVNQVVKISWTGGAPTMPDSGFSINYLQIMQCWGDDPAGPDRTQCQFGGLAADLGSLIVGAFALSRQVDARFDPEETLPPPGDSGGAVYVPFWPVGAAKPTDPGTGNINDFFDSQVTNEIPVARTHGDGTGEEFFEMETVRQAAGLGCGEPITTGGVTKGRSCWLVIVPRGSKEPNGVTATGNPGSVLNSSPLSQSNWDHRIVVPLEFQPVSQVCPVGAPERPVIGQELAVDAVTSWQPALCSGGGSLFSYTQLTDDVARSQVPNGQLAVVTDPIPPDQVAADHPLVYAPVGLSALAIAFNINYQPDAEHQSAGDLALNGRRFTAMKLTPRLVAKLLTQSYRFALLDQPAEMKNNPTGLLADPEFLNLNPEYGGFVDRGLPVPDALAQINGADITSLLWRWIIADPDARAFLAGSPDQFGMVINPNNRNLALPTSTFPRNDQSCADTTDDFGNSLTNCNLDLHPYATDMHNAGRSASRGDTLARQNIFDNTVHQPVSTKFPRQLIGARALMAVVDAATAARYDLPTAELLNAAGKYVAPTTDGLLAGEKAMKPSAVAGALTPDPAASDPAAYPLTSLSYAVTSPTMLDAAASKDYAAFLRYAGGPGQRPGVGPGQLPPGMVPLPDPLKAQTIAAATTLEKAASTALPSPPQPAVTGTATGADGHPTGSSTTTTTPGTQTPGTNGGGQTAGTPPDVTGSRNRPPATQPRAAQQPLARGRTPSLPTPVVGAVLGAILAGGLALAISSPAVRLLGVARQRRQRKGVTPTER